jgi:hypothetical protein
MRGTIDYDAEMREPHLDLFALTPRLLEYLGANEGTSNVASGKRDRLLALHQGVMPFCNIPQKLQTFTSSTLTFRASCATLANIF